MTMLAQLWQRRHRDNSKDACASMATTPSQQGQQHHCNDGKNALIDNDNDTIARRARCQLEDGNNAIAMMATMPLRIMGNNAIVTRAMTPSQQRQGRLHINSGNNSIITRATIAITTTVETLHINGNNAITMWVMTPACQQVARATMLAQQRRRHAYASTTVMTPS
jgi:hypothetical protein